MAFRNAEPPFQKWWILKESLELSYEQYGEDSIKPRHFAQQLLLARNTSRAGVKFITSPTMGGWDHHSDLAKNMKREKRDRQASGGIDLWTWSKRGLFWKILGSFGVVIGRTCFFKVSWRKIILGVTSPQMHTPNAFSWSVGVQKRDDLTGQTMISYSCIPRTVHVC